MGKTLCLSLGWDGDMGWLVGNNGQTGGRVLLPSLAQRVVRLGGLDLGRRFGVSGVVVGRRYRQ